MAINFLSCSAGVRPANPSPRSLIPARSTSRAVSFPPHRRSGGLDSGRCEPDRIAAPVWTAELAIDIDHNAGFPGAGPGTIAEKCDRRPRSEKGLRQEREAPPDIPIQLRATPRMNRRGRV